MGRVADCLHDVEQIIKLTKYDFYGTHGYHQQYLLEINTSLHLVTILSERSFTENFGCFLDKLLKDIFL